MRITYVGNFLSGWTTENDVRLAFEALGHDVVSLQENTIGNLQLRSEALNSDLFLITGTWDDALDLGKFLGTMQMCAKVGIPTATLHLDTFWNTSRGGREWWLHPQFHTAHIFTADGDHQDKWRAMGKNHYWLPPAVRHTVTEQSYTSDPMFECDVAFVGSDGHGYHEDVWGYRKELVDKLEEICQRRSWVFKNPGGRQPKIERQFMGSFYKSAKVTVGDSLCLPKEKSRYWSDRVPEATGREALLIMPQIDALKEIYPKLPMYQWGDWEDLESKIECLLAHEEMNADIRSACYVKTCLSETYVDRAQTILETVGLGG